MISVLDIGDESSIGVLESGCNPIGHGLDNFRRRDVFQTLANALQLVPQFGFATLQIR